MSNSGFTFRRVREEMIETLLDLGIKDIRVLDAISQVPRHIFLDEALWSRAYENRSLTIGYKQTISQPYIVARMTELLISHTNSRGKIFENLLELGSGCGYQSAVLSFFCENVFVYWILRFLEFIVEDLFKQLHDDNVIYAEIRFAPLLHCEGELNAEKVVDIICKSASIQSKKFKKRLTSQILFCGMDQLGILKIRTS